MRPLPILLETDDYVVVGKPSGLFVHRTQLAGDKVVAIRIVERQLSRKLWPGHRIDRGASGCLVLAKRPEAVQPFHDAMAMPSARKCYLALVRGQLVTPEPVVVSKDIQLEPGVFKPAETEVRALASCPEPRCSLVLAWPRTGRNHQVRRHLRDLNHPVLRDGPHGDSRENARWKKHQGLWRLALHCLSLEVPLSEPFSVQCPIPPELREVWSGLPLWEEARAALPALDLPAPEGLACRDPWWRPGAWSPLDPAPRGG